MHHDDIGFFPLSGDVLPKKISDPPFEPVLPLKPPSKVGVFFCANPFPLLLLPADVPMLSRVRTFYLESSYPQSISTCQRRRKFFSAFFLLILGFPCFFPAPFSTLTTFSLVFCRAEEKKGAFFSAFPPRNTPSPRIIACLATLPLLKPFVEQPFGLIVKTSSIRGDFYPALPSHVTIQGVSWAFLPVPKLRSPSPFSP